MTTSVKLTKTAGGNSVGDVIDINDEAAQYLINSEYAEAVETKPKVGRPKSTPDAD
jgi:hypothetical protein